MRTDLDAIYLKVAGFFDMWVRCIELETRVVMARDAGLGTLRALIISPPTDKGIEVLSKANPDGQTELLLFSDASREIAERYVEKHGIKGVELRVAPFFQIPDGELYDVVFADCFFDFLEPEDLEPCIDEIARVLRPGGSLFSAVMDSPHEAPAKLWAKAMEHFPALSQGCHPVDIGPLMPAHGLGVVKEVSSTHLGFPLSYVHARKVASSTG